MPKGFTLTYDRMYTMRDAQKAAQALRKEGFLARIVTIRTKTHLWFSVYRKDKTGRK